MTGYLLDTHVMLWWLAGADMAAEAEQVLDDASHQVFLSSASAWEMSIKQSKGRLTVPADRLLIAQAQSEGLTVVTADARLHS